MYDEFLRYPAQIYENTRRYWAEYDMCEKLVKRGTGGSAGVAFLRRTLETPLFPELIDVRTHLGAH